jgi:hypothetical protein
MLGEEKGDIIQAAIILVKGMKEPSPKVFERIQMGSESLGG